MAGKRPIDVADRAPALERHRRLKMAKSVHAFVRGNVSGFYDWLATTPSGSPLPEGPPVWICGDCHLGNLGPQADTGAGAHVQVRDLDQAVIGNPAYDLVRLGLSLATAARNAQLPGIAIARMIEGMVEGYAAALRHPDEADGEPEPEAVRSTRRRALGRRWKHLAKDHVRGRKPAIPLGKKFWPLADEERGAIEGLFRQRRVHEMILGSGGDGRRDDVSLIDAAYWRKGCSSLGKLRFIALVGIDGSDGRRRRLALLDIKEAVEGLAPRACGAQVPADHADRVVAGARAVSPDLAERMLSASLLGKPIVLREIRPQDLKLNIDQFCGPEATRAATYLAYVIGRAHAQQMDAPTRAAWRRTLDRPAKNIQAPSWLWTSIVELSARHEADYLEHCRLCARNL